MLKTIEAFWKEVLHGSAWNDPGSSWFRARLQLEGRPELVLPREGKVQLGVLTARRYERGFLEALAQRHLALIDRPLDLDALLEIPVVLPETPARVLEVLRRALAVDAPLVHRGTIDAPAPGTQPLTVTTQSGVYPNGAGSITQHEAWRFELRAPVRLRVVMECSSEEGMDSAWSIEVLHQKGAPPLAPLMDAFKERGLYASAEEAPLA